MRKNKPGTQRTIAPTDQRNFSSTTADAYHVPVLLHECMEALCIQPEGVYVDVTFGGGGHSRAILQQLSYQGRLIAFDQDADAAANAPDDPRFTLVQANFSQLKKYLRLQGVTKVNGIIADLGVSSHQFDTPARGFSYRLDGPLDMRMNAQAEYKAADLLNNADAEELQRIFSAYGEVRNAKTLAQAIVQTRASKDFQSISDLLQVLDKVGVGDKYKYQAQVFQALRIAVNDELNVLQEFLLQTQTLLCTGGRLAVITFHSLEDRLVKNFLRHGHFGDEPHKDEFGNIHRFWKLINKKPIEPSAEERQHNPRSHSAKLRVAEKIEK